MNVAYELSKVREAFGRIKKDMTFLSSTMSDQSDDFLDKHKHLSNKVDQLALELQGFIQSARDQTADGSPNKYLHDIKLEIRELKKDLSDFEKDHSELSHRLMDLKNKSEKVDLKKVQERVHSSELEIYLLKERMIEKDLEVRQLKEVNQRLFEVVDQLAQAEMELASRG